jgi:hypothetical protein
MTLSLVCMWLILDDFFGKKYVSTLVSNIIPNDMGSILKLPEFKNSQKAEENRAKAKNDIDKDDKKYKTKAAKDEAKKAVDMFYGQPDA